VWVRAKLNGKEGSGILDTGADGTAVDIACASKIGLTAQGKEAGVGGGR
jgi:predicted aspartyl protease